MPKRPRAHQLEEIARTELRRVLPTTWVCQDIIPDYGLDVRVELFDDAGGATGKMLFAQLKATDRQDLPSALVVRLTVEQCRYYDSLDLPPLVVVYHAPSHALFAKWFLRFGKHRKRKGQKYFSFRLDESDRWIDCTARILEADLDRFRKLLSPTPPLPIPFRIDLPSEGLFGLPANEIDLEIRRHLTRADWFLELVLEDAWHEQPRITVTSAVIVVDVAGLAGSAVALPRGRSPERARSALPYDILICVAMALVRLGHHDLVARLGLLAAPMTSLAESPEVGITLALSMARGRKAPEAAHLASQMLEASAESSWWGFLMIPALANSTPCQPGEADPILRFLERRLTWADQTRDKTQVATANYTLANFMRHGSRFREALRHYVRAFRNDPMYAQRPYWCREVAGVLFDSRRYALAAVLYRRAVDQGLGGDTQALLADALFFAGRFGDAVAEWEAFLDRTPNAAAEWVLKKRLAAGICSLLGTGLQHRNQKGAAALSAPGSGAKGQPELGNLERALRLDGLCGLAWFNLGVCHIQRGERDDAFEAFLAAALISRSDTEAWCNAVALAFSEKHLATLFGPVAMAAFEASGDRFLAAFLRFLRDQPAGFPVDELYQTTRKLVVRNAPSPSGPAFRLLSAGTRGYVEFEIGRDGLMHLRPSSAE